MNTDTEKVVLFSVLYVMVQTVLNYIGIEPQFFIKKISSNPETIICSNLQCIDQDSYFLIKDNTKIIAYLNYLQNC